MKTGSGYDPFVSIKYGNTFYFFNVVIVFCFAVLSVWCSRVKFIRMLLFTVCGHDVKIVVFSMFTVAAYNSSRLVTLMRVNVFKILKMMSFCLIQV